MMVWLEPTGRVTASLMLALDGPAVLPLAPPATTLVKLCVAHAAGNVSVEPTWASVWRSADTTEKFGSFRSCSARCVENGLN